MKIFIGWDGRDALSAQKCAASIRMHASGPVHIRFLKDWELRYQGLYSRPYAVGVSGQRVDLIDMKPFSTDFSFTRFLVPHLADYADEWVLFCDPDMIFQADVFDLPHDPAKAAFVVPHNQQPKEAQKMGGLEQTSYARKNWSSLIFMNPSRCKDLTPVEVNSKPGGWLHGFGWLDDSDIGFLDPSWNWLEGHDPLPAGGLPYIKVIHYTRGTPDLPGCERVQFAQVWQEATPL
jgi:hypothetical protein